MVCLRLSEVSFKSSSHARVFITVEGYAKLLTRAHSLFDGDST